jgi:formamidopyrimidine-DNA glycosylase
MPELPEVHTTVEGIKKTVVGKIIKDVWSDFHLSTSHGERKSLKNEKYYKNFRKTVKGTKIIGAERRGKNILIHLNNLHTIIIHMKLTGALIYKKDKKEKYVHLAFTLSDKSYLLLSDLRRFASITISKTEELHLHHNVGFLGPEPLHKSFSAEKLYVQLQKRKSWPIKSALLDQSVLAGIGNIYSDEILWETGIHPLSKTGAIPKNKFAEIFEAMQKILKFSIKHGAIPNRIIGIFSEKKAAFKIFTKFMERKIRNVQSPAAGV